MRQHEAGEDEESFDCLIAIAEELVNRIGKLLRLDAEPLGGAGQMIDDYPEGKKEPEARERLEVTDGMRCRRLRNPPGRLKRTYTELVPPPG